MSHQENLSLQSDDTTPQTMPLGREFAQLLIVTAIALPLQLIAVPDITVTQAAAGLAVLVLMCVGGILLGRYIPIPIPSVAWISLIGIVLTLPFTPWGATVVELVQQINFLALAVPCLAYAGIAISQLEIKILKRSGWKILVVAVFVLFGTYITSALIAHFVLGLS
jgi:hypothetical protein